MKNSHGDSNSTSTNPLLRHSQLSHEANHFDLFKKEHFLPALEIAVQEGKANLDRIRNCQNEASFENTVLALELASEQVSHVGQIFFNLLGTNSDDDLQAMARDISPKLADFSSDVLLDANLFQRVKSVWDKRANLQGEDLRLTEKTYKDFARNGALLDDKAKASLRAIDQQLSSLGPEFSENVLKATNAFKLFLSDRSDLEGLPPSVIEAAAYSASQAGEPGKWLFTLHGPSLVPFMTYSARRELREKVWRASNAKAFRDSFSNASNLLKIVALREERARLLGFRTHADFVLEERMAETPDKVTAFLGRLLEKSMPAAQREKQDVAALKKAETGSDELMPWDFAYYSEKLKQKLHDLDEEELRPFFKLENVVEGVFEHARRLYGLKFKEIQGLPVYHPDVKVYEVVDENNQRFMGLFYTDFFPRESKRGGAWMSTFRDQGMSEGSVKRPHVTIVCNFTKPTETKPSLLSLDEVSTLFHEFGHALHALLSDCRYVSIGGTNVYWDFVELPSQIMENWVKEKEALDLFAVHYETGEKIAKDLTDKIRASAQFQAGTQSVRQTQFALLDMAWHSLNQSEVTALIGGSQSASIDENATRVAQFERQITDRVRLLPYIEGSNSSCSFSHIFAGGYSAGYYSYKWAEVLDADAFELFKERGLFNAATAAQFRNHILARGGTEHPMELYKKFRGREPDPDALLRRDGLIDEHR